MQSDHVFAVSDACIFRTDVVRLSLTDQVKKVDMFAGILINKDDNGQTVELAQIDEAQLPEGDVTIDVEYSTLNYKDGLAITGSSPVVRKFPMVPGIDLVGVVNDSSNPEFKTGDRVVLNGWGVGEGHWGGLAQKARLKGEWLIKLPEAFDGRQAMAIGTASAKSRAQASAGRVTDAPLIAGSNLVVQTEDGRIAAYRVVVPDEEEE